LNFDPGQDTPLLAGACKATKHHGSYVSHLITNCHFSFFTYHMSTIRRCILAWVKVQSSYSAVLV